MLGECPIEILRRRLGNLSEANMEPHMDFEGFSLSLKIKSAWKFIPIRLLLSILCCLGIRMVHDSSDYPCECYMDAQLGGAE